MLRGQPMPGSKSLKTLNCFERRIGIIGTVYEAGFAGENLGLRHCRALRSTLACVGGTLTDRAPGAVAAEVDYRLFRTGMFMPELGFAPARRCAKATVISAGSNRVV